MRPLDTLTARALSIALAVVLDLAFGDPRNAIHPVAWLGVVIKRLERALRVSPALSGRLGGVLLAGGTALGTAAAALGLSVLAWRVSTAFGVVVDALLIWLALAARSLAMEGRAVARSILASELPEARERLARIVARDTSVMDEAGASKAAIESLGENVVDGVVAPLMWAALLGPAGAWLHKAASTLDSMVGYRTEKYVRFGTASARLDDVLAWLPARIALGLIAIAAAVTRCDARGSLRVGLRDRLKHDSPNSAHGEAAFAGALGVRLGGDATYHGEVVHRPVIGDADAQTTDADSLLAAARLVMVTCAVAAVTMMATLVVTGLALG